MEDSSTSLTSFSTPQTKTMTIEESLEQCGFGKYNFYFKLLNIFFF